MINIEKKMLFAILLIVHTLSYHQSIIFILFLKFYTAYNIAFI